MQLTASIPDDRGKEETATDPVHSAEPAVAPPERARARVEHVGSLLRPADLREELERVYTPGHTAILADERARDRTRLHELEDAAIADVVRRQEELGVDVLTDGEFRRLMFTNSFYDAVEGVGPSEHALEFRADDGSVVEFPGPVALTGRLRRFDNPAAREAGGPQGNELTEDIQWRKLEVLMEVGERVWGR